jgi:hypothetical protein
VSDEAAVAVSEESWGLIEDDGRAGAAMLTELGRVEALTFDFHCDGLICQQYASGRRVPNVYGLTSTRGLAYSAGVLPSLASFDIAGDNQIAIGVETMTATVGAARPWCTFETTDGDFKQRQRATRKGDFFYGLLKDVGFYTELPNFFRDMLAWSWAPCKSVARKVRGKVKLTTERCLPSEVKWDRAYSLIPGASQPIYHHRPVRKEALKRQFPAFAEQIATAPTAISGMIPGLAVQMPEDFVFLSEGWWPSVDGTAPGRHILMVGDTVLNAGKTKMDADEEHPFTFLVGYNIGPGWQYQGLVEQALADQLRLNKQNAVIWENQHRGAQNRWLVEEHSNVTSGSLVNRAAVITTYNKTKPELVTWQANPPELYDDRDRTRERILRRFGISQMQAQGTKPAGLNSGEAIREYNDTSSSRLTTLARNLETFVVDTVKKLDKLCEKAKPVVKAPGRRGVRKLTWDDVSMDRDQYTVELGFPISSLPRTPEGQVDKANELLQMGKIDAVTYARLTLNADVPAEINALLAARDAVDAVLDDIVEDGKYVSPDDGLDLKTAFERANSRYWRGIADKYPEDIMGMLADWRDEVKVLMDKQSAPAPAPAAAAPGMPAGGAPMVPPGNLIPGPQQSQFPQQPLQ